MSGAFKTEKQVQHFEAATKEARTSSTRRTGRQNRLAWRSMSCKKPLTKSWEWPERLKQEQQVFDFWTSRSASLLWGIWEEDEFGRKRKDTVSIGENRSRYSSNECWRRLDRGKRQTLSSTRKCTLAGSFRRSKEQVAFAAKIAATNQHWKKRSASTILSGKARLDAVNAAIMSFQKKDSSANEAFTTTKQQVG